MKLWQAILYFFGEAFVNLRRGWRTSLIAVVTIAISLFVGGVFLIAVGNAGRLVEEWRGDARIVLYLSDLLAEREAQALRDEIRDRPEVEEAVLVSGQEAVRRFREYFPRMVGALDDGEDLQLPSSVEVRLAGVPSLDRREWLDRMAMDSRIESVDDDVEWLGRLDRGLDFVRVVVTALWFVFATGTMITIASLVRLSAFAYREEIDVMRLVGATEFVIRGPFYLEGMLQGLIGGVLAVATLFAAHGLIARRSATALTDALLGSFLTPGICVALIIGGCAAGLLGALLSLPRE